MSSNSDVNLAFNAWRSSTGPEKDLNLEVLINQLESYAGAICWQRLPDHPSAFDGIINDAVWHALRDCENFREDAKFTTWFYRIVVNRCTDFLRDLQRRAETALDEGMLPMTLSGVDAKIDLAKILNKLEGEDRQLFKMMAEGEDFGTIGEALKIDRDSASKKWRRLTEKIRYAL